MERCGYKIDPDYQYADPVDNKKITGERYIVTTRTLARPTGVKVHIECKNMDCPIKAMDTTSTREIGYLDSVEKIDSELKQSIQQFLRQNCYKYKAMLSPKSDILNF